MNDNTQDAPTGPPTLAQAIAAHSFTHGMSLPHLKRLTEVAMFKQFGKDEVIFREGEPANRFYLISQGKVALEPGANPDSGQLVQYIGAGDVLGWSWLFPPYYWHFSARAVEPTEAIFFYGTRLREQCERDTALGYELMKRVSAVVIKRLQSTRMQLLKLQQERAGKP